MRLPQSKIVRMALFFAAFMGGLFAYSFTIGQDSMIGATTRIGVDKLQLQIEALKLDELPAAKKVAKWLGKDSAKKDRQDHLDIRDACMDRMFVEKSGDHFSQSRWEAKPVPYQFKGLSITGPEPVALNATDHVNGIDKRVYFEFQVDSYRTFEKDQGKWSAWKFDQPPKLDGLTLIREKGHWKVSSGANRAYSVD